MCVITLAVQYLYTYPAVQCNSLPASQESGRDCSLTVEQRKAGQPGCVNWNQ